MCEGMRVKLTRHVYGHFYPKLRRPRHFSSSNVLSQVAFRGVALRRVVLCCVVFVASCRAYGHLYCEGVVISDRIPRAA